MLIILLLKCTVGQVELANAQYDYWNQVVAVWV